MMKRGKGSSFEREICVFLSLWWTNEKRDDVFWRTAGSGARATVRKKKGKKTFGQSSDIQATDPIGQRFMDCFSIELKRGYNNETIQDDFDRDDRMNDSGLSKFIAQASRDAKRAGTRWWMLIHKRDRRKTMVYVPYEFITDYKKKTGIFIPSRIPFCMFSSETISIHSGVVIAFHMLSFFEELNPNAFEKKKKFHPSPERRAT